MYYQMTLPLIGQETDNPRAATLLATIQANLGFIPNMYAAMANAPELLETYLLGDERFRQGSSFSPIEQEIILLSISYINGCSYCMTAHSTLADSCHIPAEVTDAIRAGARIPDDKLQILVTLTQALVIDRGWVGTEDAQAFFKAGYTEKHILDIILAIGIKTLSNYTNHLFKPSLDAPFQGRFWQKPA